MLAKRKIRIRGQEPVAKPVQPEPKAKKAVPPAAVPAIDQRVVDNFAKIYRIWMEEQRKRDDSDDNEFIARFDSRILDDDGNVIDEANLLRAMSGG